MKYRIEYHDITDRLVLYNLETHARIASTDDLTSDGVNYLKNLAQKDFNETMRLREKKKEYGKFNEEFEL